MKVWPPGLREALQHFSVLRLSQEPTLYRYMDPSGYATGWSIEHTCAVALNVIDELEAAQRLGQFGYCAPRPSRLLLLAPLT
jgi:hypothetical protein